MTRKRFPLHRLPLWVYEDVLKLLDIKEHFSLAGTSKKSFKAVQKMVSICCPQNFRMDCSLTRNRMEIVLSKEQPPYLVHFDTYFRPVQEYISMIVQLFKVTRCELSLQDTFETHKDVIQILKDCGISKVSMWESPGEQTNLEAILDVYCNIPEVHISRLNAVGAIPTTRTFEFNTLSIENGIWFSIGHLTESFLNCKKLYLKECRLSNADVNTFLKRWIEGSKMERCCIENSQFNLREIIGDIPVIPAAGLMLFIDQIYHVDEGSGYIIQQKNDGPRAIIVSHVNRVTLTTEFEFPL
ncbi:hypothetical protein B9Z55_000229 [Caenorhabditis nigoni]|uniref:F-box domain-containing protein n=1 Tax=Caenorhabditis nigoni TaxID=1611254 RepID=A0A2G5VJR7_9PELO|nr:hypothetical protein B9Z55_000229 [Caenorhabditis nigoni]